MLEKPNIEFIQDKYMKFKTDQSMSLLNETKTPSVKDGIKVEDDDDEF